MKPNKKNRSVDTTLEEQDTPLEERDMTLEERFLEEVLTRVRFAYDRAKIREELRGHIEDRMDYFLETGETEEDAEAMAIARMGNPEELGNELNREHSPLLGWIWYVSQIAAVLCVTAVTVLYLLPAGSGLVSTLLSSPYEGIDRENVIYEREVGKTVQIDDRVVIIEEVLFEQGKPDSEAGRLHVIWRSYEKRLNTAGWSFNLGDFFDDKGNEYYERGGYRRAGRFSRCRSSLIEFPRNADALVIDYDNNGREFHIEVPLEIPQKGFAAGAYKENGEKGAAQ